MFTSPPQAWTPEDLLAGCGLPQAWQSQSAWRVLDTHFGEGQSFLSCWQAWRADPLRPLRLHYCAVVAVPPSAAALQQNLAAFPGLGQQAAALLAQWAGLLPGFHRLTLESGQLLLTLCVGERQAMLRELDFEADSLFLTSPPAEHPAATWDLYTLKALARCCRHGTRFAGQALASGEALRQCGFLDTAGPGLCGSFAPAWTPKRRHPARPPAQPGECVVLGAGLSGASVAASLARRGWQVRVLDAAPEPAQGASALPAGVLAPHVSPDDSVLSRLSRAGLRLTLQQAQQGLIEGQDWAFSGVLEHRTDGSLGLRADQAASVWSQPANADQRETAALPSTATALWHAWAGWIKPAALVRALLDHPAIRFEGKRPVAALRRTGDRWQLWDSDGRCLAETGLLVLTAAWGNQALIDPVATPLPLQAVRGLVSWAPWADATPTARSAAALPFPVNGHGNLVPRVPGPQGDFWVMGSSFERDQTALQLPPETLASLHQDNHQRLCTLLPGLHAPGAADFGPHCRSFVRVRCASLDRLPVVGPLALPATAAEHSGLWVSTAMGARGLSFAQLCAELLCARLHREPLPVEQSLAKALDSQRFAPKNP